MRLVQGPVSLLVQLRHLGRVARRQAAERTGQAASLLHPGIITSLLIVSRGLRGRQQNVGQLEHIADDQVGHVVLGLGLQPVPVRRDGQRDPNGRS